MKPDGAGEHEAVVEASLFHQLLDVLGQPWRPFDPGAENADDIAGAARGVLDVEENVRPFPDELLA